MFWAAIVPGLLLALGYALWGLRQWPKDLAAPVGVPAVDKIQSRDLVVFLSPLLLIGGVLGTVVMGWATLSESAVFGVLGSGVLGVTVGEPSWRSLWLALVKTAKMWANIALILIGALVFTISLKAYGGDLYLQSLVSYGEQPFLVLAVVLALFFALGFFLEFIELTALLVPVFGPVLFASDIDPVWIGVLIGLVVQTSFLTPPMGLSLFYFQAANRQASARDRVSSSDIYRGIVPFVCIQVGVTVGIFCAMMIVYAW